MSVKNLQDFETKLKKHLANHENLRPFVCEGSPLECELFLVGFNPATELSGSFWDFWKSDYGFDKDAWLEHYKAERQHTVAANQRRHTEISPTRRVLSGVAEAAAPVKCLETNLYSVPTRKAKELTPSQQSPEILDFLIQAIWPKVVVLHGKEAEKRLDSLPNFCEGFAVPHFSLYWSNAEATELGHQLKEIIEGKRAELNLMKKSSKYRKSTA